MRTLKARRAISNAAANNAKLISQNPGSCYQLVKPSRRLIRLAFVCLNSFGGVCLFACGAASAQRKLQNSACLLREASTREKAKWVSCCCKKCRERNTLSLSRLHLDRIGVNSLAHLVSRTHLKGMLNKDSIWFMTCQSGRLVNCQLSRPALAGRCDGNAKCGFGMFRERLWLRTYFR